MHPGVVAGTRERGILRERILPAPPGNRLRTICPTSILFFSSSPVEEGVEDGVHLLGVVDEEWAAEAEGALEGLGEAGVQERGLGDRLAAEVLHEELGGLARGVDKEGVATDGAGPREEDGVLDAEVVRGEGGVHPALALLGVGEELNEGEGCEWVTTEKYFQMSWIPEQSHESMSSMPRRNNVLRDCPSETEKKSRLPEEGGQRR